MWVGEGRPASAAWSGLCESYSAKMSLTVGYVWGSGESLQAQSYVPVARRRCWLWVRSTPAPTTLAPSITRQSNPVALLQARTFKVAEAAAYESLVKRLRSLAGGPDSRDGRRGGGAAGAQQQQQQQHQGGQHGQGQAHGHGLKNGGGGGGGGGGGRHGGRGRRHTRGSHDGTGGAEGKDWREGREGQGEGGEAEMRRRYVRLLAPPPRAPPAVPRG